MAVGFIEKYLDTAAFLRTATVVRHRRGLPMRGQRTRTNARTRKGPRKAAQALKK